MAYNSVEIVQKLRGAEFDVLPYLKVQRSKQAGVDYQICVIPLAKRLGIDPMDLAQFLVDLLWRKPNGDAV